MATTPSQGICYLTGAGPGDLGLVTLKARQLIETAEVIVYDYLCNPEMLRWAPPGAEIIYAGKKAGAHTLRQEEINALLVEKTASGKRVVRLKGGDPFLFGRGGEEALALVAAGLRFEIVPGVTSAIAAPAYAGIPVTHRGINAQLTIFTGHEDPEKSEEAVDYAKLANQPGTRVMLMGVQRLEPITSALIAHGAAPETPIALVRWGTTGRQQTVRGTLADIAGIVARTGFTAPAVAVIGEVVALRESLNWHETRPLFGRQIVVTRTRTQAGALSESLRALGADVQELPTIRIEPPEDRIAFGELVQDAHTYTWLIFTSPNGVDAFFELFFKLYSDAREIGGVRIAAIGPATAARVRSYHLAVDLQPQVAIAEEIVATFLKESTVENEKILIVRPESARNLLATELTKMGAIVDEAIAYRTVPETDGAAIELFRKRGADLITFTSGSTVENFMALGLTLPPETKTASIGPITSKTMKALGLRVDIEAKTHHIEGLTTAIREFYEKTGEKPG
ncbi:MAG TPA: uroporphyrinogen-III C-methyltransferase [Chthoniobacteraceae bacterium]|nr:uroporphyrinogen-III C-methyltransferase [Chthoniobacteraceae bacterium]